MELTSRTALLLVDVQRWFDVAAHWGERNNLDAERNITRLLQAWRAAGRPVRHLRHDSTEAGSPLHPSHPGNRLKPEAEPAAGEIVYGKSVNSGFIGTTLEQDLRGDGVDSLVIVGLTTNHCVSTTARMAANLGLRTAVVSDATATFARRALDGRMRPAQEVHLAALSDLKDEFAEIVSTDELLGAAPSRALAS